MKKNGEPIVKQLLFDNNGIGDNFKTVRIWKPTVTFFANLAFSEGVPIEEIINRFLIKDIEKISPDVYTYPIRLGNDGVLLRDRVLMFKKKKQEWQKTRLYIKP